MRVSWACDEVAGKTGHHWSGECSWDPSRICDMDQATDEYRDLCHRALLRCAVNKSTL